jgi:mono/diheme cytochrome c family protein
MRWRRPVLAVGCALLSLSTTACRKAGIHPGYELYFHDMAHSTPYDAFQPNPVTRDGKTLQRPVPGTVPVGHLPFRYAATPEEAVRAGRELTDPFPATAATLARGQAVYQTFCWVCHGSTGQGDGPIIPRFPNPPAYNSERVRAFPEGQIFHVITRGTAIMPSYAAQISPEDRWKVVRYVETLQRLPAKPEGPETPAVEVNREVKAK